ncbi:DUF7453 family protein [Lacipirellula parvula]|uniref:Ice-binding protein C-terminal domain-containing protein n=1 Tax=Lacipirellula parvula TaxID=2650471 RepID=A0A5K7X5N4_9BACT|nr:choice-of-anchor tandem repeat NxxGxxAF-containing protein [Lacipirellula parvula]BBO31860.1 hypothetical protein PLANPX_1472 [Lacipirellula parvula]
MKLRIVHILLVAALTNLPAIAADRIVAQTGDSAPGTTGQFSTFFITADGPSPPVLNNAGRVAFSATLTNNFGGVTAPNDTGVWSDGGGALALVAREGSAAPGGPAGALFRRAANPVINSSGAVAFGGLLRENVAGVTLDSNSGIWSNAGGPLQMIAREGTQAVDTPAGVDFATLIDLTLNNAGQTAFRGTVRGAGVDATNEPGIWAQNESLLHLVARGGQHAAGTPAGTSFKSFFNSHPSMNQNGAIAFRASIQGTGVGSGNDVGIWARRNNALSLVAREGSQAAGLEAGRLHRYFATDPVLNASGTMAYVSQTWKTNAYDYPVIYVENDGVATPVVRSGDVAPGSTWNTSFFDFSSLLLNNRGDIAFQSLLSSGMESIWVRKQGSLQRLALQGTLAPGADGASFLSFSDLAFNNAGQVAFVATLSGSGIYEWNDAGIWASTPAGELRLVAVEEQSWDSFDLFSSLDGLFFEGGSGNGDGQRSGFNDRGELAYLATYSSGGNRLIVSDKVALSPVDFDGNGAVDGGDFLAWQRGYGKTTGALPAHGDANGDGDVDAADLAAWRNAFGSANAANVMNAVPEPATGALVGLGAIGLLVGAAQRRNGVLPN